jgi:chromatin remodeling complex protein RSC6
MEADGMTGSSKKSQTTPAKAASAAAKAPAKTAEAKKAKPATSAFTKPLQPSKELAAVVGSAPLPRTEVVSKMWEYIKKHKLQNEANKREILADEKLTAVFGKDKVTMFEMNKFLAQHLK